MVTHSIDCSYIGADVDESLAALEQSCKILHLSGYSSEGDECNTVKSTTSHISTATQMWKPLVPPRKLQKKSAIPMCRQQSTRHKVENQADALQHIRRILRESVRPSSCSKTGSGKVWVPKEVYTS